MTPELTPQEIEQINREAWIDIPGYPGFKANMSGQILGRSGKLLKGHTRKYVEVTVVDEAGSHKIRRAHQLVARAFIPNPENKPHINHKNGIKTDNRVENLEWCTHSENIQHAWETGLYSYEKFPRGGKHPSAKITDDVARQMINLKGKMRTVDIARKFNISRPAVWNILYGKAWEHLDKTPNP